MNATILAALLLGQSQAPIPPQAPPVRAELVPSPAPEYPGYAASAAQAVATGQSLVTFLGTQPRAIAGAVSVRAEALDGYTAPAVIVSVPGGDWLEWRATLPATATDAQIGAAIRGQAVSLTAVPFETPRPRVERDDSDLARGPWPASLPFPDGMERYRRARFTQSIAVVGNRDSIAKVPRSQLEAKWQQSGGTLGLSFRSDVYRDKSVQPQTWVANIPVLNSSGDYKANRGHVRSYPDGAKFLDVLSTSGKVFEIRQREKVNGVWDYAVVYEDAEARPAGYVGVRSRDCQACHSESGSGAYGAGLVPGGDETISDPFPQLER